MEELKEFIRSNTNTPFIIKKSISKYYKGYSHVLYLTNNLRHKGLFDKLRELGFVHTPYMASGGKYCTEMYIKRVSNEPLPPTPQDKYLWVCPECGELYYIPKDEKYKLKIFTYNRTVCDDCAIENQNLYEKFGGTTWKI